MVCSILLPSWRIFFRYKTTSTQTSQMMVGPLYWAFSSSMMRLSTIDMCFFLKTYGTPAFVIPALYWFFFEPGLCVMTRVASGIPVYMFCYQQKAIRGCPPGVPSVVSCADQKASWTSLGLKRLVDKRMVAAP